MNVKKVIPSGYCKGVIRAIELAKKTRLENKEAKIYVLGMIVHNRYVAEAWKRYRIETLDDKAKSKEELLDKIDDGIVIFTAHGIADRIKKKAEDKGLKYVDASCDDVIATQKLVKEKIAEGYKVLYIGKKSHPEALAILSISEDIHLIANLDDLSSLKLDDDKIFVTNQTTMSLLEVKSFFDKIAQIYPKAVFAKEICNATTMRQNAILNLKDCDMLYIVGDPSSNNSMKLKELGEKVGIRKVRMIEDAGEITETDLGDVKNVYVTSGASTPAYLQEQVIAVLKDYAQTKVLKKPKVDLAEIL